MSSTGQGSHAPVRLLTTLCHPKSLGKDDMFKLEASTAQVFLKCCKNNTSLSCLSRQICHLLHLNLHTLPTARVVSGVAAHLQVTVLHSIRPFHSSECCQKHRIYILLGTLCVYTFQVAYEFMAGYWQHHVLDKFKSQRSPATKSISDSIHGYQCLHSEDDTLAFDVVLMWSTQL